MTHFIRAALPDRARRRAGTAARAGRFAGALLALAAALLLSAPAHAQITLRGSASAGIASTGNITHVGAGAAATSDAGCPRSVSPARPAGNVGDLLVALAVAREDAATVATPTGWALLYSATYAPVGQEFRVFIFYRIATGTLATQDTITITESGTCGSLAARVSRFRNVDATQPFLNVPIPGANVVMQNSNNIDTGTETTIDPNAMLLVASFVNDNNGITQGAGWNISFESGHNLNRDLAFNLHYQLQTTAGAKSVSNWDINNTDENIGVIFSLRPSGLRINVPAGTVPGDVMVASIAWADSAIVVTPPAGWTPVRQTAQAGGGGATSRLATYFRVAGGAEPASYLWTFSNGSSTGAAGGIASFAGVDVSVPASIVNAEGGAATGSSATHTAAAINTTVGGTMLVGSFEFGSSTSDWTAPGGMTEVVDVASQPTPSNAGISMQMAYQVQTPSGATGPRTATASTVGANADQGAAHLLALRPLVVFVATGNFNAFETSTGAGALTGRVYTKLVGTNFTLDVVAVLGGAQFATFTDAVQVDLVTGSTGGANCPGTPVAIAGTSQNVNLTNGRGTTGAFNTASAYPDARVRVRYPVASPTLTSCSTDNFTIRPVALSAPASSDMTNTGSGGGPNKKAGDAFNLSVGGGAGYTGTPLIDSSKITAHAGAIQVGALGGGFSAAVGGTASGSAFIYGEVGNFTIGINGVYDETFANVSADRSNGDCTLDFSNALVGGRYGCYFGNNTASAAIGRFTPDHFDVALNAPVFTPACGSFTYVGQGFSYSTAPVITVTARNSAGLGNAITRNYTGAWQKITTGSLTYPGGSAKGYRAFAGTLDATNAPSNPTITAGAAGSEGTVTLSFSLTAPGLFFQRLAQVAPFDADISLALNVIDTDSVAYASNPAKFGNEVAGGGMVFSDLNALTTTDKSMRFGRLRLGTASGSQLVALSLPMETQYWNGTAFVTNAADNCTTLGAANVGLGNFVGLASGDTTPAIAGAFSSGRKTLTLSPPGGSKVGTVDVVLNLNAAAGALNSCTAIAPPPTPTAAGLAHLRGQWCPPGPNYDRDATARARFGVYRGAEEVIFIRENY